MRVKKNLLLMFMFLTALGFTACSDDDDDIEEVMPSGSITVMDQQLDNGTLTIGNVEMSQDGWVVIHRDNGNGGPMVPEIISEPVMVDAGETSDVTVQLKDGVEIEDGDTLWAMLHTDDGEIGVYEFDGSNGLDAPIMTEGGAIVTESFTVSVMNENPMGTITVVDQAVMDNTITVGTIELDQAGFVVVHADNGEGGPQVPEIISEPVYLEAGTNNDVEITFTESADVNVGDTLWIMLHNDTGEEGVYEFDGENGLDMPLTDENEDIIVTPIEVIE